jgi:hypothetical protein
MVIESFGQFFNKLKSKIKTDTMDAMKQFVGTNIYGKYNVKGVDDLKSTGDFKIKSFIMDPDGLEVIIQTTAGITFGVTKHNVYFNDTHKLVQFNAHLKDVVDAIKKAYPL